MARCTVCGAAPRLELIETARGKEWCVACNLEVCTAHLSDTQPQYGKTPAQAARLWHRDWRRAQEWQHEQMACEPQVCWECGGRGEIVTCFDDLCRGRDECIHGDGNDTCPNCGGTGEEP